jgi:hypothetical protein
MLKIDEETMNRLEIQYPGIRESILFFENAELPACPHCGSEDTANVQAGILGRTISIATAITKFRLVPKRPKPGSYYCNACKTYFD